MLADDRSHEETDDPLHARAKTVAWASQLYATI